MSLSNAKTTVIDKSNMLNLLTPNSKIKKQKRKLLNSVNFGNSERREKVLKICRICYNEEDDKNNPLVQPCNCSGSMKYVHLKCLKHWINTRSCVKIESNSIFSSYLIKPVECELCKTKLPDYVNHNGKLYEILNFESDYKNYLVMENLTLDKHNNKYLYAISMDENKKIKIGRGHDANLVLNDISISRVHCFFTIDSKNVYLEDNNSKFGTLVLIQNPNIKLTENLPLYIQVGRTFLRCRIKPSFKIFSCCGIFEKPNVNFYHQQNQKFMQKTFTIKTEADYDDEDFEVIDENGNKKKEKAFYDDDMLNNTRLKLNLDESEKSDDEGSEQFKRTGKRFLTNQKINVNKPLLDKIDSNKSDDKNDNLENSKEEDEISKSEKSSESIELESEDESEN